MGGRGNICLYESANTGIRIKNNNSFGEGALAGAVTKGRKQVLRLSVTQDLMKGSIFMRSCQNSANKFNEKRCMTRIILSIISIVLCTAALSASTYAWYRLSITSDTNTVSTADYSLSVTCDGDAQTATMSTGAYAEFTTLSAASHTLTLSTTSTVSGFAVLVFDNGTATKTYYTTATDVTCTVPAGTTLKVYAHWGAPDNFSNVGEAFTTGSTISFE